VATKAFTARIRWRCERDHSWEVETWQGGFASAEDAALWANGFSEPAAAILALWRGKLELTLTDQESRILAPGSFHIWRLPDGFDRSVPADDSCFREVQGGGTDLLTDLGLDGEWQQIAYGVLGPQGETIDVILELDDTGKLEVTTIEDWRGVLVGEGASFSLGVVPRA
jgi:hypothetical protein